MDVKSKGLLRRMFDAAVAELAKRASASEPSARRAYRPPAQGAAPYAPTPTPRQAEVAPDPEPSSLASAAPATEDDAAPVVPPPHAPVVIVRADAGELRVRWNVEPSQIARSAALLGEPHVACLRLITYGGERDRVVREVVDRPNVAARGECEVREVPERLIATFGLRAGERFVSVAHAVL